MFARNIHYIDSLHETLIDDVAIERVREGLLQGDVYIARRFVPEECVFRIRQYLEGIGTYSLPNYRSIERSCPNFHRIDRWDPRAHVKACVHSFSFFPWNHDVFGFFELFRPVYQLKNRLSNLPGDIFLGFEPEMDCTARLSFQYYPSGIGGLNRHQDPFDYHQITVPVMIMSKKGHDFEEGGVYVEQDDGSRVVLDDICGYGDVIYFNAQCFHGVEKIDPRQTPDWLSQKGRWMALFAVNKLADNTTIADSKDLGL